jgi:AraC family ethanolamine operon transcriptional activator
MEPALSTEALDESALYSLVRRETRDADEQAACLRDWDQVYEQLSPGQFEGRFMEVWFRGIQLFREVTNQSVHEEGLMRAGDRVLGVPVAMQGQGYFCGRPISPDAIMTMRGGDELDFRAPEHFDIVAVSVPVEVLTRYATEIEHRDIERELQEVAVLQATKSAVHEFRGFLLTALESVSRTPAMLQYPAMQKGLEHALLSSVVKAVGQTDDARATASPTARHAIVSRAQDYMREHVEEPLTVEDSVPRPGRQPPHAAVQLPGSPPAQPGELPARHAPERRAPHAQVGRPAAPLRAGYCSALGLLASQPLRQRLPPHVRRTPLGNAAQFRASGADGLSRRYDTPSRSSARRKDSAGRAISNCTARIPAAIAPSTLRRWSSTKTQAAAGRPSRSRHSA